MFVDFINQTIYGDKGVYFAHFSVDKEAKYQNPRIAFKLYIDMNEYHNKLGYNRYTIQEEYPILDEIIQYIVEYYNSLDNYNEDIRLEYDAYNSPYYYDTVKGCWAVYFYKERLDQNE